MGCEFSSGRKPPGDLNINSPEIRELLEAYPQHRPLILGLFEAVRNFSPEVVFDRWYRVIRDELPRLPPRNTTTPSVEAPGDLPVLLRIANSGHLCMGRLRKGEMLYILGTAFRDLNLPNELQISPENFMEFAKGLPARMKNYYRNFEYGFLSSLLLFTLLQNSLQLQHTFNAHERLSLFLAVLGAYYDHPLMSSAVLIQSRHTLAVKYLGSGCVEQHCASEYVAYLQNFSLVDHLDTPTAFQILRNVKQLIEALETEKQTKKLAKWQNVKFNSGSEERKRTLMHLLCSAATAWPCLSCDDCKSTLQKQLTVESDREAKLVQLQGVAQPPEETGNFQLMTLLSAGKAVWREVVGLLDDSEVRSKVESVLGTK